MAKATLGASVPFVEFHFNSIRNITSPEDAASGRKVYSGVAPAASVISLPNDENVRDYLVDMPGKKRRSLSAVHRAMFETLADDPSNFSIKNGGVVIVARDVEVDEQKKIARLLRPSLINGAQTQGVLADYLEDCKGKQEAPFAVHPKFELVITSDEELIGEISIARNSQNSVDPLSIAGKRHVLDDLRDSMLKAHPAWKIRESETDGGENYIDTPKLLQVTTAMIPPELWPNKKDADNPNKVFTYSMRAKCLKDFQKYFDESRDPKAKDHASSKLVYDFIVEFAPRAWDLYLKWKQHQGFAGNYFQQGISRDARKITDVADGLIFPILAALAVYVEKSDSGWVVVPPILFEDKDLIDQLKQALRSPTVNGNPWNCGKSRDAYTLIYSFAKSQRMMAERYAKFASNNL